ncbi:MAG: response regulator [Myxococcota bacterium]
MRVLFVEDDAAVRDVVCEYLISILGYTVDAVSSGREALELIRSGRRTYDVALIDWQLPGITGRDVVADMTSRHPDTAVLITTGQNNSRLMHQTSKIPQVSMIRKPFALGQLRDSLQDAFDQVQPDVQPPLPPFSQQLAY